MKYQNSQLRERLAAEFVLGTLHGQARRRFEALLADTPALRASVARWENRLHPLSEDLTPQPPPEQLWPRLQARLTDIAVPAPGHVPTRPRRQARLWYSLPFWRGFGLAAAGLLLGMTVMLMLPTTAPIPAEHIIVVTNRQAKPLWVISTRHNIPRLTVKTLHSPRLDPGYTCVLWLTWRDGHVQPLGALPERAGQTLIALPKGMVHNPDKAKVVISIETIGEKHTRPRGHIIFKGPWTII